MGKPIICSTSGGRAMTSNKHLINISLSIRVPRHKDAHPQLPLVNPSRARVQQPIFLILGSHQSLPNVHIVAHRSILTSMIVVSSGFPLVLLSTSPSLPNITTLATDVTKNQSDLAPYSLGNLQAYWVLKYILNLQRKQANNFKTNSQQNLSRDPTLSVA